MLICTQEHVAPSFGVIPEGSLWDEGSEHVGDLAMFATVPAEPPSVPVAARVRKFGAKPAETEETPT